MKTEKSYLNRISSSILILLLISLGIFSTGKLNATSPGIPGITIAAPTALDATEVTLNSFKANWSSDPNDEYYQLYVYRFVGYVLESIPVWEVLPSYNGITVQPNYQTIQGLSQNTRYKYLVYAYDIQDNKSLKSNEMEVVTHGAAPVAKAATSITTVSFTANWNASSGAVSYMLTVNDITSGSTKFSNRIVSGLSYSVTGLNPNNAYSYDVKANFDVVVSVPSNLITVNTLPTPPIATTASTINTTSFNANWNAVAGATGYKLWVYSNVSTGYSPAGYFPKTIGNFTSYTISGLTSGHSYSYFVQVITSLGISTASNTIEVTTKPIAPAAMDASDITFNSFVANWQTVVGATGYKISVWTEVGSYPVVGYEGKAVTGNSTTVTGLSPET
ncbi:MAG TPA: fibronectin type III domain-containing protein, partial [Prolixibacteraceae bacterium]|nr:fibronectin type III domain-containing protein [Prolixibacteraceae bacterium]